MNILDFSVYVFDLDGVIINSEPVHYQCYKESLTHYTSDELDWNSYCSIHHSIDKSFESQYPENYRQLYEKKNELYKNRISNITLMPGFYEFFSLLIKNGKYICIVTDASDDTVKTISDKFSFLKKSNIVITRNNTIKRKPNSECYIQMLNKLPTHIENHEIICFEDSYKGWIAASNVIYNCVLVNNSSYVYYDTINAQNAINDFTNITLFNFKQPFQYKPFYVSSKTHHRDKWNEMKNLFPIVSNWININKQKQEMTNEDKELLCMTISDDINLVDFGILYLERNETDHIGTLIEMGILLSKSKQIYICGDNIFKDEVLFNFKNHLNFKYANNLDLYKVFRSIQYDINHDYKDFIKRIHMHNNVIPIQQSIQACKKPIDYIVICASGKGTRLLPITKDIPKLLVNIDNLNLLNKITNYWRKYSNKFVVIIDSKYNDIVDFYLRLSNIQYELINVDCVNGEENSYTLNKALSSEKYTGKKILITWCDIYPESIISEEVFDDNNIIFTYKNYGRYDAIDNEIIKKQYGNIIGIYYFSCFNNIKHFEPKMDICDCYKANFGDFKTYEIESLTDIGDYQKLYTYLNNKRQNYITRYFNSIHDLSNNILEKRSTCSYGDCIIANEMLFYKYNCSLNNIPEIVEFGFDYFKMKKILNAQNAIDAFNEKDIDYQRKMLKNILISLDKIHNLEKMTISNQQLMADIKIEFYDKVMGRIDNIDPLLYYFNHITTVNGVHIKRTHKYIIDKIYKQIQSYFCDREPIYNTIHGDPHMSNILIDTNNKIWFIDPRGYFGNTKLFGLKEYDIGKIMYSLSGFDQINNNNHHFFIIDDKSNINTNIVNNIDSYISVFDEDYVNTLIGMTILHWFGLTDYSKNNIHKCISSYYNAIYLYHLYYE